MKTTDFGDSIAGGEEHDPGHERRSPSGLGGLATGGLMQQIHRPLADVDLIRL